MKSKSWFWFNYGALALLTLGLYWWVALVNQDKSLPDPALRSLQFVSLVMFGALCWLVGDLKIESDQVAGFRSIVLRFVRPVLKTPIGTVIVLVLGGVLAYAFNNFRTIRLQSLMLKESPQLQVSLEMKESGYVRDITPAIEDSPGLTVACRPGSQWPKLIICNKCGFDRKTEPIANFFIELKYLAGNTTDPMEVMENIKSIAEQIEVEIHYRDASGKPTNVSGLLNPMTANITMLTEEGILPSDVFSKAAAAFQEKNRAVPIGNSDNQATGLVLKTKDDEGGPVSQFEFWSGGNLYHASFDYRKRRLDISEDTGGAMTPRQRSALGESMAWFAKDNKPDEFVAIQKEFADTNSVDRFMLWNDFFERLRQENFWTSDENMFPALFDALAKIVSLFVTDDAWIAERSKHPLCDKTIGLLRQHALSSSSECALIPAVMKLLLARRPFDQAMVGEFVDALQNELEHYWSAPLEEVALGQLEDPTTLNSLYEGAGGRLERLLQAWLGVGHNKDQIQQLLNTVEAKIQLEKKLTAITSHVG